MPLFACAISCHNDYLHQTYILALYIKATNIQEAKGAAYETAQETWKPEGGHSNYNISIIQISQEIVDTAYEECYGII